MKSWVSILAAAAILVVAAPAGYSASGHIPTERTSGTGKVVKTAALKPVKTSPTNTAALIAKLNRLIAKNKALRADNKALAANVGYLQDMVSHLQAVLAATVKPASGTGSGTDPDEACVSFYECTDEQNCRIHGNNCHLVNPPAPPVTEPTPEPTPEPEITLPVEPPVTIEPVIGPLPGTGLECASLVDPAITDQNANDYDWSC